MTENLGTVKIVFDDKSSSSATGESEIVSELKTISGAFNKLISGSLTGLLGGAGLGALGTVGATVGGIAATGAAALAGNQMSNTQVADWLSEGQGAGTIKSGNFNIDEIKKMAMSGDIDGLQKALGSSKEKAQELIDKFVIVNNVVRDINGNIIPTFSTLQEELKKTTTETMSLGEALDAIWAKISRNNGRSGGSSSSNTGTNVGGGYTVFSDSSGNAIGYENANNQTSNMGGTYAILASATYASNQSCTSSRTSSPVTTSVFNTNTTNSSRVTS